MASVPLPGTIVVARCDRVTLTSYSDEAILTEVETWADTVVGLA